MCIGKGVNEGGEHGDKAGARESVTGGEEAASRHGIPVGAAAETIQRSAHPSKAEHSYAHPCPDVNRMAEGHMAGLHMHVHMTQRHGYRYP